MKCCINFLRASRFAMIGLWLASSSVSALTIQDAIKDMLANNPDVQSARQQMLAREHEVRGAKAGYLPTLDAEAGVGREWTRSTSTGGNGITLTREEAALRLRQTVYDGDAAGAEIDRQKARYKSALFNAIDTQENAALRGAQAYINVLRHAELLSVLKESLDQHQKIYDQSLERQERGNTTGVNVKQIAVRLSLANSNFIAGKNNFLDALSQFQGLVGYIPDASSMEEPSGFSLPSSLDESLQIAFANHPTLKSAQADIEAAEAQHAASKSKYFPKVTLEGDRTWNEDIDGVPGDNEDWVLALRVRYNIYNGGKDKAKRKQTAELLQETKEIYRGAQWETEEGMRLSWYAFEATQQQLGYLEEHVQAVIDTNEGYNSQFGVNRRALLDLLNIAGEKARAQQTYTNTKYDQLYSQIRVLNSSGQLTQALGIE